MNATAFALLVVLTTTSQTVRVRTDMNQAPGAAPFVAETEALVQEWYPKIHEVLSGLEAPLAYGEVRLIFQRKHPKGWAAWVDRDALYVTEGSLRNRADSYGGMIAHEIAHIAQDYNYDYKDGVWVVEGTADYIRHKYFEKDIESRVKVDARGRLWGYDGREPFRFDLQQRKVDLRKKGYRRGYTVASSFLYWLEQRKDPAIVRKLHAALAAKHYSDRLFEQHCGAKLDALWAEFIAQCERPIS